MPAEQETSPEPMTQQESGPPTSGEGPARPVPPPRPGEEGPPGGPAPAQGAAALPSYSTWDPATKRMVVAFLVLFGALLLWISRPVLPLVILAWIISYLLSPVVDTCQRFRIPRWASTVVLYALFLVILILTPVLLVPVLLDQLQALVVPSVPTTAFQLFQALQTWVANLPTQVEILGIQVNIEGMVRELQATVSGEIAPQILPSFQDLLNTFNQLITTTTSLVGSTAVISLTVVGGIFNALLFLLFLFFLSLYMTKDAPLFGAYVQSLFPPQYQPEAHRLLREIGRIWHAFFRGQLALSTIMGLATWGVLSALGMPGALILGILAGVLEVIPNVGPVLAMIPAVIVALIQGSTTLDLGNLQFALLIIGVYFVLQQLENQLLVPRIIGSSVHLHPVVVMCGILVGASVGGILGAFLAAPTIASGRVIGRYLHAKLLDQPPPFMVEAPGPPAADQVVHRTVIQLDEDPAQGEEVPPEAEEPSAAGASSRQGKPATA